MSPQVSLPAAAIRQFCSRYGVSRLSLFGSVLRDDFRPDSDIDVLVEFLPNVRIGLLGLAAMERELSDLLGRSVDLRTPADLSPYFRDDVVKSAVVQYAA